MMSHKVDFLPILANFDPGWRRGRRPVGEAGGGRRGQNLGSGWRLGKNVTSKSERFFRPGRKKYIY